MTVTRHMSVFKHEESPSQPQNQAEDKTLFQSLSAGLYRQWFNTKEQVSGLDDADLRFN